jgi:K+-sensing histidine kinase KdpD
MAAPPELPVSTVLEALGFALFLRDDADALRLAGHPPAWLSALWPSLTTEGDLLPVQEASPFLENFLLDAAEVWAAEGEGRGNSGPWIEQNVAGAEISLEARALRLDGAAVLLLERLGKDFEARKEMLQKARETVIAYQRLNSETQKKEILLSCIADEMNAALGNAVTALRLIEMEKHSPRAQQLLSLAMRATEDQQALINKVLTVFASELEGLYGRIGESGAVAAIDEVLDQVKRKMMGSFAEKSVLLRWPNEMATAAKVAMSEEQLARVLESLLECALENAPTKSAVTVEIRDQPDEAVIDVWDEGTLLPISLAGNLFSREPAPADASPLQMRLQFCRVALEKGRGEFTLEARPEGGNCFRLRIPKAGRQQR